MLVEHHCVLSVSCAIQSQLCKFKVCLVENDVYCVELIICTWGLHWIATKATWQLVTRNSLFGKSANAQDGALS